MSAIPTAARQADVAFDTRNDIQAEARSPLIGLLDARLADGIDLLTQTKQAHWNVKGPGFFSLHQLFDKLHEDVGEYVDLMAERAVQLGGVVHGTARQVAARSGLPEYPVARDGRDHLDAMRTALAEFGKTVRAAIEESDRRSDRVTADLFTEIARGVDKWLWLVEAHLQAER